MERFLASEPNVNLRDAADMIYRVECLWQPIEMLADALVAIDVLIQEKTP